MKHITLPKGSEAPRERLCAVIGALDLSTPWSVHIKEYRPTRSLEQNAYLWGVCYETILEGAGETLGGWTANDLHEYFLGEHFGWEVLEGFGKKRMKPLKRSSKLNKQEFSDYIAFIQQKAAEFGVYIPDAEEQ